MRRNISQLMDLNFKVGKFCLRATASNLLAVIRKTIEIQNQNIKEEWEKAILV